MSSQQNPPADLAQHPGAKRSGRSLWEGADLTTGVILLEWGCCTRPPSSSGLGHRPFKAATGIRIPLGAISMSPVVISRSAIQGRVQSKGLVLFRLLPAEVVCSRTGPTACWRSLRSTARLRVASLPSSIVPAEYSHPFGESDLPRRSVVEKRIPCQLTRSTGPEMIAEPISRPVLGGLHHDYRWQLLERPSHRRAA